MPMISPLVRSSPSRHRLLAAASAALVALCPIGAGAGASEPVSKDQMQGLDDQVQEIKSDVLAIAAELSRLEEKLLYPSNTQVAVFVSAGESQDLRVDSLQLRIDGELVAHHIYSFKELEALRKGGVQRIYTGNLRTGEHQLDVSFAGKRSDGSDFGGSKGFRFQKEVEPKLVEITLADLDAGAAIIDVEGR